MTVNLISPAEFSRIAAGGASRPLIDVRTPGEFAGLHAETAINLPFDQISVDALRQRVGDGTLPVYLICKSGGRSGRACEQLVAAGMTGVFSIEGGTDAWAAAGLPVVRGKGVISIERQVRIGAGGLVVLGVLLGLAVSQWFLLLSGFVGAGLVFAGVTDWCGMGLLLAKMPWNQKRS